MFAIGDRLPRSSLRRLKREAEFAFDELRNTLKPPGGSKGGVAWPAEDAAICARNVRGSPAETACPWVEGRAATTPVFVNLDVEAGLPDAVEACLTGRWKADPVAWALVKLHATWSAARVRIWVSAPAYRIRDTDEAEAALRGMSTRLRSRIPNLQVILEVYLADDIATECVELSTVPILVAPDEQRRWAEPTGLPDAGKYAVARSSHMKDFSAGVRFRPNDRVA